MSNLTTVSETWVKDGQELVTEYITGFDDPSVQIGQDMDRKSVELQMKVNGWKRKDPPQSDQREKAA